MSAVYPNWWGVVAVALSFAAFAICHTQLRHRPWRPRALVFAVLALCSVPSVLVSAYCFHLLPERELFYTFRSWPGTELLVIFLGGATGALATLLPRYLLILPLLFLGILAPLPYLKPFLGPIPDNVFEEQWKGDICLQSTPSTCGPASLCTILKQFGKTPSERAVARASYSYAGGTEAWYLARQIRAQGLVPRFEFWKTFSPEAGLPAVVGVRSGGAGHFIAVLGVEQDHVTFADPLSGVETMPLTRFQKRYTFTGFHLVVFTPEDLSRRR